MKLSCPKNSEHKRFSAAAHVTEDWEVDEHGDFLWVANTGETQVVTGPCFDVSVCMTCGAPTEVSE